MMRMRSDESLCGLDIEAAVAAGMAAASDMAGAGSGDGAVVGPAQACVATDGAVLVDAIEIASESAARGTMFAEAAIAASRRAEELGVGPYPLAFLAGCVRTMGLGAVYALPEPLIGEQPTVLVRGWMVAAGAKGAVDTARDEMFARWLERVAMLIAVRRQVVRRVGTEDPQSPGVTEPPSFGSMDFPESDGHWHDQSGT